mgnify:CR=1 FL=1
MTESNAPLAQMKLSEAARSWYIGARQMESVSSAQEYGQVLLNNACVMAITAIELTILDYLKMHHLVAASISRTPPLGRMLDTLTGQTPQVLTAQLITEIRALAGIRNSIAHQGANVTLSVARQTIEAGIEVANRLSDLSISLDAMIFPLQKIVNLRIVADSFLNDLRRHRSPNTHRTYRQAIEYFLRMLERLGVHVEETAAWEISPDWIREYVEHLGGYSISTEHLYLTAVGRFYEYVNKSGYTLLNLAYVRATIKQHKRTPLLLGPKLALQGKIESVLAYVETYTQTSGVPQREQLRRLRDRAFIFTLADTGLRISEACRLTRGHIDWAEGRAIIIKGGRESVVRFSGRALAAIKAYLGARAELDGATGRALASLAVFARHDDGAGSKVLRLNTVGAREIVDRAVIGALGGEAKGSITPHSFRHYFVTVVLRSSGGNLKLAQELARHKNIAITQRYAHLSDEELDQNYHEIFNRGQKKE